MEKTLIIGNVVALLASLFMVYSGDFKKENTNPNSTEYTNNTFNNK